MKKLYLKQALVCIKQRGFYQSMTTFALNNVDYKYVLSVAVN